MDIFLLEAILNGLLLGGVLALLSLGLNLIFGVIDVVWIAYAELVMVGMYIIYWVHIVHGLPLVVAGAAAIGGVGLLGLFVHLLIIEPILGPAPINPPLATRRLFFPLPNLPPPPFRPDLPNPRLRPPTTPIPP